MVEQMFDIVGSEVLCLAFGGCCHYGRIFQVGCSSVVFFLLMGVMALFLVTDLFTGQDGGVHLAFLLFFGILSLFSWGLSGCSDVN
jgi:predicted membrane channel-forming protein YqfA (hemolysin III family)